MPNFESNEDELTILIYPDNNATTLSKSLVYANEKKYKYMRAVFIDGTWYVLEYVCLKKIDNFFHSFIRFPMYKKHSKSYDHICPVF